MSSRLSFSERFSVSQISSVKWPLSVHKFIVVLDLLLAALAVYMHPPQHLAETLLIIVRFTDKVADGECLDGLKVF